MNYKHLILLLSLIFFSSALFAYSVGFDYAEVRTTSYPNYLPYQYASYYDTIDLRYGIYGTDISNPVNIVVSPKVYGINLSGQRVFVHNIQTQSFVMQPYGLYTYAYNPMFYFDPAYQSYEVVLDLQSLDGQYYASTSTYVYSTTGGTVPQDPSSNTISCDDFSLSGFSDIYLDEDERDSYFLYLTNSIGTPLTITSITTTPSSPSNLEIRDITFPYVLSGYQTRSAEFDLFADTVSSNYTGFFDIKVVASYNNLTCTKTFPLRYKINNSSLESNASCNDFYIPESTFSLSSNQTKSVSLNIENKSSDYYFEVKDLSIKKPSNSIVSPSIKNSIYRIYEDSSKPLNLSLSSQSTSLPKTENLTLEIDGYFKRDNREDKRCKISKNIQVKVTSGSSSQSSNECNDIKIFTRKLTQLENTTSSYSKENGFYILNNSNKKFTITGLNLQDNSVYATLLSKSIDYEVYPTGSNSLNFDLSTNKISSNTSLKASVSLQGYFDNGAFCNYNDVSSSFDVVITKKDDACHNVGVLNSSFKEGNNLVTVYNNTSVDFSVNDVISLNNQNTNVSIPLKAFVIPKNSQKTISVGTNGAGSFELLLKGKFSDGKSCDYTQTSSGFLSSYGYSFSENSCAFDFKYPNVKYISLEGDYVDISFKNLSNKEGVLKLSATGAVIENPLINFSANSDFSKRIYLTNINHPKLVLYTVDVYGCTPVSYFTNLYPFSPEGVDDVSFVTYTSNLSSIEQRLLSSFTLKNNSSKNQNIEIRFAGFPTDFIFVTTDEYLSKDLFTTSQNKSTIHINPNSSKNINFGILIPSSAENTKYNGYVEIYSSNSLLLREPFSIDRTLSKEGLVVGSSLKAKDDQTVLLNLSFENNLSTKRNLYLSIEEEDNFSIEGSRVIVLEPFSKLDRVFTVTYTSSSLLKYKLIDTDNSSLAYQAELDLKNAKRDPSFLSGFFSLSNIEGFLLGVFILLLILFIYYFLFLDHNKQSTDVKKSTLKIKEEHQPLQVVKTSSEEKFLVIENVSSKQITLRDLDGGKL